VSVEIARLGPEDLGAVAADIVDVYREAFGSAPYFEGEPGVARFASEALPRHAGRDDFRLVIAREAGAVAGFGYGYTGARGQWWHDWVVGQLDRATVAEWAREPFEVVELAVRPAAQGRGTGGRLHDALLAGLRHRTALLSTWDLDSRAVRLYRGRGWMTLRRAVRSGPAGPAVLLMGLKLPGPAQTIARS
jgi:ribosomal protein S18 acetylase RimI-like enzyme